MITYYYIVILIIIILLSYKLLMWNVSACEEYLCGFWTAGEEFCTNSDINSMMLFIGRPEYDYMYLRERSRQCYIVITDNLSNQGFSLTYTPSFTGMSLTYSICARTSFEDESIWPESVNIDVNILTGALKIYTDDIIYAKLNKCHDLMELVDI